MKWYVLIALSLLGSGMLLGGAIWLLPYPEDGDYGHTTVQDPTTGADMHVQDLHVLEQAAAVTTWELFAREAAFSELSKRVDIHQLRARLSGTVVAALSIVADYGQIDATTGDFMVRGHVQLQQEESYALETEVLHWQATDRILRTPAPVSVRGVAGRITGTGFRGDVDQQQFILERDVHASFQLH